MTDLTAINNSWFKVGYNKQMYDFISRKVLQSAKDLMEKKLIPKYAWMYLQDPKMLGEAIDETMKGPFREWSCPKCAITVYGPKKWMHLHLGHHGKFKEREGREHEIYQMKFKLY